jgi:ATP-dependent helicase/nuclease subunit A
MYDFLDELDEAQRKAACAESNVVVAAGAGSGKTKTLAARYAYLVMERKLKVDEILTLTFTNKAVSEMYSRIYGLLAAHRDNKEAREAVRDFQAARISTLDSFCAHVARTAARRYGINPDFSSNNDSVEDIVNEAALPFVLNHRENPALAALMADNKIRDIARELFAGPMLRYSPVSRPLDFDHLLNVQKTELLNQWNIKIDEVTALLHDTQGMLAGIEKRHIKFFQKLETIFYDYPETPAILPLLEKENGDETEERARFTDYFQWLYDVSKVSHAGANAGEFFPIKKNLLQLRETCFGELSALANTALQWETVTAVFPLVAEFQTEFNKKKREAGILTFNDIARLAVDALASYPDIRRVYKDMVKAIMIDEFQDNNSLQRDLIFLLAEQPEREAAGLPAPH